MEDQQQPPDTPRNPGEKIWDATVKTFHNASFRASQYKRIVQKKIDLNAIHKKITGLHNDLGRLVDENRELLPGASAADARADDLLRQLDGLKQAAATLEEEIGAIREEQPAAEEPA